MVKVVLTLSEAKPEVAHAVGLELHRKGYQFKYAYFTPEHEYVMGFQGERAVSDALSSRVSSICSTNGISVGITE